MISQDLNAYLGLNDWQSSQTASLLRVRHLGGTLEETRVQVEDVTGVGLTTWKKKRRVTTFDDLTVWRLIRSVI